MADSKDKNKANDFDDFGFSDDEEESSTTDGAKAIDEKLLHEVEQPRKSSMSSSRSSGLNADTILNWLQHNKMAVGGGLVVLVVIFTMVGHGGKRGTAVQAPAPVVAAPTVEPENPVIAQKTSQQMIVQPESPQPAAPVENQQASNLPEKVANTQQTVANTIEQQTSAASIQVTEAMNDLNRRLESLEGMLQEVKNSQQSISNLSNELKGNQQAAAVNAESIKRIELGMSTLNNTLQSMQKVLFRQALFEQAMKPGGKQADYIVQATIPGRAWLRNLDGILITVREGQEIPGFGKVAKIDPLKGTVTMSNQTIFKEE